MDKEHTFIGFIKLVRMLLSIIIPIYNGEKTLPDLLNPILEIKRNDIEFILVDDGSKDESYDLCKRYSENDTRVKAIHIENSGVSAARNIGLSTAVGKYIYFCDCDDRVFTKTLIKILALLEKGNYDLVMANYVYLFLETSELKNSSIQLTANKQLEKPEIIKQIISPLILKTGTDLASLWNKFFLLGIIKENNLQFNTKIYKGEDWQFVLCYLRISKSAYFLPDIIYEYRIDGSQATNKYRIDPGIHLLLSTKLKIQLANEFNIVVDNNLSTVWYANLIKLLVFSGKSGISNYEWKQMINDEYIRLSAKVFIHLKSKDYLCLGIPRKYKLYSLMVLLKLKMILRVIIKNL